MNTTGQWRLVKNQNPSLLDSDSTHKEVEKKMADLIQLDLIMFK